MQNETNSQILEKIEGLYEKIDSLDNRIDSLDNKIDDLDKENKSEHKELYEKVSVLEGKLSIIEKLGYAMFVSVLSIGGILLFQIFKLIAEVSKITNVN